MRRKIAALALALTAVLAPACDSEPEIEDSPERNVQPGIRETPRDEEN